MKTICESIPLSSWSARLGGWLAVTLAFAGGVSAGEASPPRWIESGMFEKVRGYRPMGLMLTAGAPEALKGAPAGLETARYGTLETGPADARVTHCVVVDFRDGVPVRMFVDANGNGDLTDDPVGAWTSEEYERPDGTRTATFYSRVTIDLTRDGTRRGLLVFYSNRGDVTKAAEIPKHLAYYTDCGVTGATTVDGRTVTFALADSTGAGGFGPADNPRTAPLLWLDANANGASDRGEVTVASRPFLFNGKWWAVAKLAADGAFQVVASEKPEEPRKPEGPDLSPGRKAFAFTAKRTDGKEVRFPGDYQGKVVLIDFWATWCGPCVAEIPNVVKAYEAYHAQGLEVLGISLDKEGADRLLADFTQRKGMSWPQVYDGGGWNAAVAKLYGIRAIPHMLLVDGDTGLIVANKDIRGEALAPAIQKALAARNH
ncbi:MAG: TlpA family protein disulfide reductase [Verrucomicrobiales bacterium]|nr:TlpA family protein disulfide reductase [Verrucomicrobiales bacterium]